MSPIEGEQTLKDYIHSNKELLTAFGIFTSLFLFSQALPLKAFWDDLGSIFLLLAILTYWEMRKKTHRYESTTLWLFKNAFIYGIIIICYFWILQYRSTFLYLIPFIITLCIVKMIHRFEKYSFLLSNIFHGKYLFLRSIGVIIHLVIAFTVAIYWYKDWSKSTSIALDNAYEYTKNFPESINPKVSPTKSSMSVSTITLTASPSAKPSIIK